MQRRHSYRLSVTGGTAVGRFGIRLRRGRKLERAVQSWDEGHLRTATNKTRNAGLDNLLVDSDTPQPPHHASIGGAQRGIHDKATLKSRAFNSLADLGFWAKPGMLLR
jgi:hypothetical protein